jgi:hypothetical protein
MESQKSKEYNIVTISVIEAIKILVRSGLTIEESRKILKK